MYGTVKWRYTGKWNKNNNTTFDFGDEKGSNRLNINTSRDTINGFIIYTLELLEK